ncbi:NUDIX domain-containing protein [candidate division GN15 bacterium]|nr:NUDIX domain-containing protein [candidate division GN15 bacterium]
MYVTDEMIAEMVRDYGSPDEARYRIETTDREIRRIRSSQRDGRNHDVTLYVEKDDKLIVIAKHMYPPGLFRAPSGGLHRGETFQDGVRREMKEEIGCEVKLDQFLLKTSVDFVHDDDTVFWRSFVFTGRYVSGDFKYTDHHEIREVALVDWSEFTRFGSMMRQTEIGGLHYRAELHETVARLLDKPLGPAPPVSS